MLKFDSLNELETVKAEIQHLASQEFPETSNSGTYSIRKVDDFQFSLRENVEAYQCIYSFKKLKEFIFRINIFLIIQYGKDMSADFSYFYNFEIDNEYKDNFEEAFLPIDLYMEANDKIVDYLNIHLQDWVDEELIKLKKKVDMLYEKALEFEREE